MEESVAEFFGMLLVNWPATTTPYGYCVRDTVELVPTKQRQLLADGDGAAPKCNRLADSREIPPSEGKGNVAATRPHGHFREVPSHIPVTLQYLAHLA